MNNTTNITSNNTYYSYLDFIRNRKDFKVVNSEDIFDNPSALFYKIIFYLVFDRYVVVMRVFLDRNLGKIIR